MEYIEDNNNIISLKEYKDKIIYFFLFNNGYSLSHFPIYLETSNYSLLYPLTDIENRTFSHELFGENWKRIYLFINITDYPPTFYFNISQVICIDYYFFETDEFELIESKIPFKEGGIRANTKDLYFSIQKNDNSSIGLVLKIEIENDIFLSIDFNNKTEEQYENITNTTDDNTDDNSHNENINNSTKEKINDNVHNENTNSLKTLMNVLGVIFIIIFCAFCYYYIKKK